MRTTSLWLACGLMLSLLVSCVEMDSSVETGAMAVRLSAQVSVQTKGSDVTERSYEKAVNSIQLFLFQGGTRIDYVALQGGGLSFPYTRSYASLAAGTYAVYAVANGPDLRAVTTESQLQSTAVALSDCGLTDATGFVMAASVTNVQVVSGQSVDVPMSLRRFAARVQVKSIQNLAPTTYADGGAVMIQGIFLVNATTRWNLQGTGEPSDWANLGGRVAGRPSSTTTADYISAASQVPEAFRQQLFRSGTNTVARGNTWQPDGCCLYAFPNRKSVDHTGNAATVQDGALTRLVVLARVNGESWWYPVTVCPNGEGLERNTSYDVSLTIRATGSTDPNEPVSAAQLTATITTASGWSGGTNYTESL